MPVQWIAGDHHGLVWPHGLAVVASDVTTDAAARLWAGFANGGDLARFLKLLSTQTGADVLSLPDFAIALRAGSGWQLAARGALEVYVDGEAVRGAGITTWTERRVDAAGTIFVGVTGAPAGESRPLVAGLVPAASLLGGAEVATPAAEEERPPLDEPGPGPEPVVLPLPEAVDPEVEPQVAEPEAASEVSDQETRVEVEPEPEPEPEAEAQAAREPEAGGRFARMFGETRLWSVEDAAVRQVAVEEPAMIAVPSFATPGTPAAPGAGIDEVGDHDGETLLMGPDGLTPPQVPTPPDDPDAGPTVLAVECVQGHPNPPQRPVCSECGGEVAGQPRRVPRPSLGTLVLPGGERIDLTAPVIVGRRPRADRVQGPVLPRLVPLSQGHVSGNHLEIRLEEWNVLAVDLHSTNGTFLRREGESPVRLGERPELLVRGDVLDLGHGVQLRLEFLR